MELKRKTILTESGFRVGVTEVGAGVVPLVFLHGLSVSAQAYEELLVALAERGFRVIGLDAANHGDSDALPWGHTIEDMTEVTLSALDELDIPRAIFAGHSMGGGMVVEIAARHPHRVAAAILLDAAAGAEHHKGVAITPGPSIPYRALKFLVGGLTDVLGDGIEALRNRTPRERVELLTNLRESVGGLRFVRSAYALMKADTVPLLKAMFNHGVPTAVLHGLHDQIVPYEAGLSAAQLTDATFYAVDGYHSWMLADPDLAGDLILLALFDLVPQRYVMGAE
ncbi:esterase/lipase protein [Mycobacterium phage 40AC]|uniref:Esterase/lipase protein n=1 Tax=Mycobacterium phage 40AC TaxID=1458717 RepID=W8ECL9_9CAUD|nr:esterase/lipase [Mycobacterium phage 40AC]AHJ86427.1 esterase/lipase protein [Mycobacterium phage 40AC]